MDTPTFVADVHLGKLARALRLLGFDTLYDNAFTTPELLAIASGQHRILLSRNAAFAKNTAIHAFVIKSEAPDVQLKQVVQQFHLKELLHPFSRCLVCNGPLAPVAKETITAQLQQNTRHYFSVFWQCGNCKRIYWEGSHYDRMQQLVEEVKRFPT